MTELRVVGQQQQLQLKVQHERAISNLKSLHGAWHACVAVLLLLLLLLLLLFCCCCCCCCCC